MSNFLLYFSHRFDPRPNLAKGWLEVAQKYEERLRANQGIDQNIVEAVIQERNRIRSLFEELLPEFGNQIHVVPTGDAQVEHCAVCLWKGHVYILVSGALMGRPFDHPDDQGLKGWEWIARHEAAHIKQGHLPWLFYTRRLFRFGLLLCYIPCILLMLFASSSIWLKVLLCLLGGLWLIQTVFALFFEIEADLLATKAIQDPLVLEDAEKSLSRMSMQAKKRLSFPFGFILYGISMVFTDPHPPFALRKWILRRHLRFLKKRNDY